MEGNTIFFVEGQPVGMIKILGGQKDRMVGRKTGALRTHFEHPSLGPNGQSIPTGGYLMLLGWRVET